MAGKCVYPVMRFVAYEQREKMGKLFVPDPSLKGRYILTDRCVGYVVCPVCKSIPGEPCKGSHGYWASTHADRRSVYQARKFQEAFKRDVGDFIVEEIDILPIEEYPHFESKEAV